MNWRFRRLIWLRWTPNSHNWCICCISWGDEFLLCRNDKEENRSNIAKPTLDLALWHATQQRQNMPAIMMKTLERIDSGLDLKNAMMSLLWWMWHHHPLLLNSMVMTSCHIYLIKDLPLWRSSWCYGQGTTATITNRVLLTSTYFIDKSSLRRTNREIYDEYQPTIGCATSVIDQTRLYLKRLLLGSG